VQDKFYHSIKDDIPIYLDDKLVEWCGYEGSVREQKRALLRLIEKYNIKTIEMDNDEYEEFRKSLCDASVTQTTKDQPIQEQSDNESSDEESDNESDDEEPDNEEPVEEINTMYPPVDRTRGKGKTRHILIMPDDFRMVVMRLPTKTGTQICRYYIELEKMIKLYVNYQLQFYIRREELLQIDLKESRAERLVERQKAEADRQKAEADRQKSDAKLNKINATLTEIKEELNESNQLVNELGEDLNNLTETLDIATDDRAPKVMRPYIRERFVIMKLNDTDATTHDYYVIRAQRRNVGSAISKLRSTFENATRALTIDCQPNSMNLFNRIKEQMTDNIDYANNYISPVGISHKSFLRRIQLINNQKKNIE
jgi:hypothetical protein